MQKLTLAIIGYGNIGKKHFDNLQKRKDVKVMAVADVCFLNYSPQFDSDIACYGSFEDFLKEKLVLDAVFLCTPNFLHTTQTLACLENGYHVICEKPLALTVIDVERIINKAKTHKKFVFTILQLRESAYGKWLKEIIDKKLLGAISLVQINCFWNRSVDYYEKAAWRKSKNQSGGPLFTQFSHFADLLVWLFGEPQNIKGELIKATSKKLFDFEEGALLNFTLENDIAGSFNYLTSVWDKNMESSITILGEKGSVKISGQYLENLQYSHTEASLPSFIPHQESLLLLYDKIFNQLKEKTPGSSNLYDHLKTIRFIEHAYYALQA